MLFDLNFPCDLTTFSRKKFLSGKVICAFICPAYQSSPVRLKACILGRARQQKIITMTIIIMMIFNVVVMIHILVVIPILYTFIRREYKIEKKN
jgi:hypothetical protein